jgi:hypothetical protein
MLKDKNALVYLGNYKKKKLKEKTKKLLDLTLYQTHVIFGFG